MKKIITAIVIVVAVVIAATAAGGFWLYTGKQTSAKEKVFVKLHLPAAIVNRTLIPASEVFNRFHIAKALGDETKGVNDDEAKDKILNKLINDTQLEIVAKQYDASLSAAELDREYKDVIDQLAQGNQQAFEDAIKQRSGLSAAEFKDKIVEPLALKAKLMLWYNDQPDLNNDVYKKIDSLVGQIKDGSDFGTLAKANSEDDASKEYAGDVGEVNIKQLLPEFSEALNKAEVGSTVVIHSRHGHHVVKVLTHDKPTTGDETIHIQEIFLKPQGFEDWYQRQVDATVIKKLINFN